MENRELDSLFKTGLETTGTYHSAEEQWEVVAARLAKPSRRKPVLWWLLGGGMGVLALCLVFLPKAGGSPPVISAFQIPMATTIKPSEDAVAAKDLSSEILEKINQTEKYRPASVEKSASVTLGNSKQGQNASVPITDLGKEAIVEQTYKQGTASLVNPTVDFNVEPIIIQQESSNLSVVKNIMILPLREISSNTVVNTPLPSAVKLDEAPMVEVASINKWSLEVGVQRDFVPSGRIDSDPKIQYYSALTVNFSPRWQARLAYGAGQVERTITGEPLAFRVPVVDVPQDGGLLSSTQLGYRNQNMEVQVAYNLSKLKKLTFSINTGLQWNKDTDLNAVYEYEGIYLPVTVEATLPDTKLLLSDFIVGVDLRYRLTPAFCLHGAFQQYFSLNGSDAFRWPLRRRIQVGLSYQF